MSPGTGRRDETALNGTTPSEPAPGSPGHPRTAPATRHSEIAMPSLATPRRRPPPASSKLSIPLPSGYDPHSSSPAISLPAPHQHRRSPPPGGHRWALLGLAPPGKAGPGERRQTRLGGPTPQVCRPVSAWGQLPLLAPGCPCGRRHRLLASVKSAYSLMHSVRAAAGGGRPAPRPDQAAPACGWREATDGQGRHSDDPRGATRRSSTPRKQVP